MARLTVNQIMQSIAGTVNQEAAAPTAGGDEWSLWLEFINRSVYEWAEAADWEVMRKVFYPAVTGISQATVTLPQDFKKIAAAPKIYISGGLTEGEEFPEALPEQAGLYQSTDKYYYLTGDISNGFSIIMHPATLASGVSMMITYYATPTSLASPAQVPVVTDSQFIVDRTTAYIFEARSDPRFQQQESKARDRLLTMIEMADMAKFNSYSNPSYVQTGPLVRRGFRVGRD